MSLLDRPEGADGTAPRIALTGAGGKTSLMQALALAFAMRGRKVLCATTTRMYTPNRPEYGPLHSAGLVFSASLSPAECVDRLEASFLAAPEGQKIIVLAQNQDLDQYKLAGPAPEYLDAVAALLPGAVLLVEADGAARFPLKAHAEHEPCIPACADTAIAVAGLDALGQPWRKVVHRAELGLEQLGLSGKNTGKNTGKNPEESTQRIVTPEDMVALLVHPCGPFRHAPAQRLVFLNKLDTLPNPFQDQVPVSHIAAMLQQRDPPIPCWAGSLRDFHNPC
jgi:probable selenium-dependent hydroxylase accessory protein YqeC